MASQQQQQQLATLMQMPAFAGLLGGAQSPFGFAGLQALAASQAMRTSQGMHQQQHEQPNGLANGHQHETHQPASSGMPALPAHRDLLTALKTAAANGQPGE